VTFLAELFKKNRALEQRTAELTRVTSELLQREHEIVALKAELENRVIRRTSALETAISDLEAEAAALQESEIRHRSLVELSPNAILVHADGLVVFANVAARLLFAAEGPEQLIGTPVMDRVQTDSRASVLRRVHDLQVVGAEVPVVEERLVRLDGTPIEVEIAASAVLYQGRHAIQVVARDITERKLTAEALRAILPTPTTAHVLQPLLLAHVAKHCRHWFVVCNADTADVPQAPRAWSARTAPALTVAWIGVETVRKSRTPHVCGRCARNRTDTLC
jgi:PAS domain S-box-containing protein